MVNSDVEANKKLARQFIDGMNSGQIDSIEEIMAPDFVWLTAVVGEDHPNEYRPMQSNELHGKNLPMKPRMNREETLAVFRNTFGNSAELEDSGNGVHKFRMKLVGMVAEGDRVAVESESDFLHPSGRRYNNFYHCLFCFRDGKLVLYKEYQDTLHYYDFLAP